MCRMSIISSIFRRRILFYMQFVSVFVFIICYLEFRAKSRINFDFQLISTKSIPKIIDKIDFQNEINENFTCVKTKYLLHLVQTTICVHDERDAVSNQIRNEKIWEEKLLIPLLSILIRYPEMSFIDAGANLGSYTMFAASYGRFVVSIECFKPNIDRIRKAVQIEKVQDKVALFGNAIYLESGKYLRIKSDPFNVGSQAIVPEDTFNDTNNDPYIVKTMKFDDILPILKERNIRHAIMKVDIQWSEAFLCLTGNQTFDYVNIPVILMEWDPVPHHQERMKIVLDYLTAREYTPTIDLCKVLNISQAFQSWPGDMFWVKLNRSEIC